MISKQISSSHQKVTCSWSAHGEVIFPPVHGEVILPPADGEVILPEYYHKILSELVIVVLHQVNNVSAISYQEQVTFWWDDDICFDIISVTFWWDGDICFDIISRTDYLLIRWWYLFWYHIKNRLHFDEIMISVLISYQEQVTFWWDGNICFDIISRTQISSSYQKVICSWYDIKTDITISSKCNLFLIWYQNRYHHLIKM
jgi:hypothetical protein